MGGNAGIASSSHEALSALDRDVLIGLGVKVPLGESEIDNVDDACLFASSSHEVVGLDIAMDEALTVYHFETGDDLNADIECSRDGESLFAACSWEYHCWKRSSRDLPSRSMTMKMRS